MFTVNIPNPFKKDGRPGQPTSGYRYAAIGLVVILVVVGGWLVLTAPANEK